MSTRQRIYIVLASLAPSKTPLSVGKAKQDVDVNFFEVSRAHLNETLLRATADQRGFNLTGELLLPCSRCLEAKGPRSTISRRSGERVSDVPGTVHLDLTGPCVRSLGSSAFMLGCLDSRSRFMVVLYGIPQRRRDVVQGQAVHREHERRGCSEVFPHGQRRRFHVSGVNHILRPRQHSPRIHLARHLQEERGR